MENLYNNWRITYGKVPGVARDWSGVILDKTNVWDFIIDFCEAYGGLGHRHKISIPNNNDSSRTASLLNKARSLANTGDPTQGVDIIIHNINGLRVSFGSKALRILCPTKAVVFDQNMSQITNYSLTGDPSKDIESYYQYIKDCCLLGRLLRDNFNIDDWDICDIEAALFQYFREDGRF